MRIHDEATERRWEAKVRRRQPGGCWLWTANHDRLGYCRFRANGKWTYAHRVAYELYRGPIPDGLELDHLCKNRGCVNPYHLEAVTRLENIKRSGLGAEQRRRRAEAEARTHCVNGHEWTEANTHRRSNGKRECRACGRDRMRERRRRA